MVRFEIETIIHSPLGTVLEAFRNPGNMLHYMTGLERYDIISGGPDEAGSEMHLYYKEKDRTHMMRDICEFCEPGKRYVSKVEGDAIRARVDIHFNEEEGGIRMKLNWSGKEKILLLKLLLPLMRGRIKKQALAELEAFGRLVEKYGADFTSHQGSRA